MARKVGTFDEPSVILTKLNHPTANQHFTCKYVIKFWLIYLFANFLSNAQKVDSPNVFLTKSPAISAYMACT